MHIIHSPFSFIIRSNYVKFGHRKIYGIIKIKRGYMKHNWLYISDSDMHLRYVLGESGKNPLICIGLNPSTAIPDYLDSTLERVRAIAKNHKCDSWIMLNIYPYRGSDPKMLPDNSIDDRYINQNINEIEKILEKYPKSQVLCAWGDNITQKRYIAEVFRDKLLKVLIKYENRLKCLKLTKKIYKF